MFFFYAAKLNELYCRWPDSARRQGASKRCQDNPPSDIEMPERAARADRKAFRRILDKAGTEAPRAGDELPV
jgi:hypothetical protein